MEDISIFIDKGKTPKENLLKSALGKTYPLWKNIVAYVYAKYPKAKDEWHYAGLKYGWSYRIKDTKRIIVYLLPRDRFFKTAFVFGQKATDIILSSDVSDFIKTEIRAAKVYAEGRGIRVEIRNKENVKDIEFLIDIKIEN